MTWKRQVSATAAIAVFAALAYTTGGVHEAVQYIVGLLTGTGLGFWLAKR